MTTETTEEITRPGWFRKGWTAVPSKFQFTSEWGAVGMTMLGWAAYTNGVVVAVKRTVTAAMKHLEGR